MIETLFEKMLRIRRVEEAIVARYPEQEMRCPVHLSIGQEAVAVGVCEALQQTDLIVSGHRAHAHYLAKGGSLQAMIDEIYGKETGCAEGRGGSMHLIDRKQGILGTTPIVGGTIPIGVGAAFAAKLKGKNQITAIFVGEGATEEGVFVESMNFASLHNLPVLFVCENNLYSVYSPLNVRQDRSRSGLAKAHNIPTIEGDGNDVTFVYESAQEAISTIREGTGPYYLEYTTYRYREHCGPNFDNHIGYRTEEEYQTWLEKCPIERYKSSIPTFSEMDERIANEIEEVFVHAKRMTYPSTTMSEEAVYA